MQKLNLNSHVLATVIALQMYRIIKLLQAIASGPSATKCARVTGSSQAPVLTTLHLQQKRCADQVLARGLPSALPCVPQFKKGDRVFAETGQILKSGDQGGEV